MQTFIGDPEPEHCVRATTVGAGVVLEPFLETTARVLGDLDRLSVFGTIACP